MRSSFRIYFVCLAASLSCLMVNKVWAGEETSRNFPDFKCRVTLPGPDWSWNEKQVANVLFFATDKKGYVLTLTCGSAAVDARINQQFARDFEQDFYQPGQLEKRSGRFLTFKKLPCYQAEGSLTDGRTSATRVFIAHGFIYALGLLGGKQPIEKDPEFESIMAAFSFTVPPEPPLPVTTSRKEASPTAKGADPGRPPGSSGGLSTPRLIGWLGVIAGVCVVGAVVLGVAGLLVRKRKRRRKRRRA